MIYLYFEIGLKPAVVSCLTNPIAPPPTAPESCFKGSNRSAGHLVCTRQKFFVGVCGFFVSDVISEVLFGSFWLILPGLAPNR